MFELGMNEASDAMIAAKARELAAVMISKDEDFVHLVIRGSLPGLVWIRLGNCRNPTLLAAIDRLWPQVEARLAAGERLVALES